MSAVLIDNWTLHDITYQLEFAHGYQKPQLANLENLLMAILLWDQVYFWDNGKTSQWKNQSGMLQRFPSLTKLPLSPEVELEAERLADTDVIASGARQYQFIAESYGIDYLPKQERFEYLTSKEYYHFRNTVWPKDSVDTVEKCVQEFYDELAKELGNIQLQFSFPLLLDYIVSQMEDIEGYDKSYDLHRYPILGIAPYYFVNECIAAALRMRETGPLYNMRSWINDLHLYIDEGNWVEVGYLKRHVKEIVSEIKKPSGKDAEVQIKIPLSASVGTRIPLGPLKNSHKIQLTFLHDLAKFGLKQRPEI